MKPWTAFIYGLLAALFYSVLAKAIPKAHIDDPVEVVPVFFVIIKYIFLGLRIFGYIFICIL